MLDIQRTRGHPVYLQIVDQIERRVAASTLSPGDPLPSVRALAQQLGLNPNTVVRAYRELEARGLVESRHGQGTFIAAGGGRPAARLLSGHAGEFVRAARELGASLPEAVEAIELAWDQEVDHE